MGESLRRAGHKVVEHTVVPVGPGRLSLILRHWLASDVDVVLVNGGTRTRGEEGTIEIVRRFLDREFPAFAPIFSMLSYKEVGSPAVLTRAVAGAAAGKLVRAVMYPVGFANYPAAGEPFRPNEVLFYMMHTPFDPSFIFDVSGYWEKKLEAIRCFGSQVGPRADDDLEPPTNLSSPDFFRRLEGRSRHFGHLIGKTFGDAYTTVRPVPMDDPVAHYGPFDKLSSTRKASGEGVA